MRDAWSPDQYERFRQERSAPFYDLLALVRPAEAMRCVDLGCGTGELTRDLHERLGARETLGVDRSASMLERSEPFGLPELRFLQADIRDFSPDAPFDLVFSNAALQWIEDHEDLLARLTLLLGPQGQLAVQVPANHDHLSHTVAHDLAALPPFCDALDGFVRRSPVLAPERYAALLHRLGYVEQHVRLQVYGALLPSREDVVEWVKGTLLTDYESRLPADLYAEFLAELRERLVPMLLDTKPYFYPFKRILFWGRRP